MRIPRVYSFAIASLLAGCTWPARSGKGEKIPATKTDSAGRSRSSKPAPMCIDESRQRPVAGESVCDELCAPTRRVGWSTGACPVSDGWTVMRAQPLFPDDLDEGDVRNFLADPANSSTNPENLCIYEWRGRGAPTPPPDTEVDCMVVPDAPVHQPPIVTNATRTLQDSFTSEVAVSDTTLATIRRQGDESATPSVMVAVVDTAPHDAQSTAARHGHAMASIARNIACGSDPSTACPVSVETFVGLPRSRPNDTVDYQYGGYYGFESDLAKGILDALNTWKIARPNARLIISLSVGWENACHGRSSTVHHAIEQATKAGALVLAASGNRRIGSCAEGFVAPAAWAGELDRRRPLLYAVTPVDDQQRDLVTFRPGSNAAIAAPGFMAVTTDASKKETYGPISGSSVATAVVAGTAALMWSVEPLLRREALMTTLWKSGKPRTKDGTTVMADLHPDREQRVVSACAALSALGKEVGPCDASGRRDALGAWVDNVRDGSTRTFVEVDAPASATENCSSCNGPSHTERIGSPSTPPVPDPWVIPQPDNPACPMCGVKVATSKAYLVRDPAYDAYPLKSTTIMLWNDQQQSATYQYDATVLPLTSATEVSNSGFASANGSRPVRGYIILTFEDTAPPNQTFSVGNEIFVEP